MTITDYSADVRVVKYHAPTYDMQLEQRVDGQWTTVYTTNEFSDDYSYINMRERASQLRDELLRPQPTPYVHRPLPADYCPTGCSMARWSA